MIEPNDPLEAELSSLRPREVSPALRSRVAAGLAEPEPGHFRRKWLPALAAGLAAACLAAALFPWGGSGDLGPGPPAIPPRTIPRTDDDSKPVLLAYQRALARSPDDLAALLDKQALGASGPGPKLLQVRYYSRSNATLDTLLGED